jgi:hypothetical protein
MTSPIHFDMFSMLEWISKYRDYIMRNLELMKRHYKIESISDIIFNDDTFSDDDKQRYNNYLGRLHMLDIFQRKITRGAKD